MTKGGRFQKTETRRAAASQPSLIDRTTLLFVPLGSALEHAQSGLRIASDKWEAKKSHVDLKVYYEPPSTKAGFHNGSLGHLGRSDTKDPFSIFIDQVFQTIDLVSLRANHLRLQKSGKIERRTHGGTERTPLPPDQTRFREAKPRFRLWRDTSKAQFSTAQLPRLTVKGERSAKTHVPCAMWFQERRPQPLLAVRNT